jgi:hypothetical protein
MFLPTSFHGLSVLFALIGSCLVFFPPFIPEDDLQSFGEAIFPYTQPGMARIFLDFFQALGIEFYGGAILSFSFGAVEERYQLSRRERDDRQYSLMLSEIEQLRQQVDALTQISKELLTSSVATNYRLEQLNSEKVQVKKNRWLWSLLFGQYRTS